jgi:hypothetical protein
MLCFLQHKVFVIFRIILIFAMFLGKFREQGTGSPLFYCENDGSKENRNMGSGKP